MKSATLANQTVFASMSIDQRFPLLRGTAHSLGETAPQSENQVLRYRASFRAQSVRAAVTTALGCASTRTHEGTGEYVDDSVITTKVKAAIFDEPGLKSSEITVQTFKGIVQLSGFVSSRENINDAVRVASAVGGVKSVTNEMQLK
jgi:osmotically-inducible protein OsmY